MEETLDILDKSTGYAPIRCYIFGRKSDHRIPDQTPGTHTAGNFYINDKTNRIGWSAALRWRSRGFGHQRQDRLHLQSGLRWVSPQCTSSRALCYTNGLWRIQTFREGTKRFDVQRSNVWGLFWAKVALNCWSVGKHWSIWSRWIVELFEALKRWCGSLNCWTVGAVSSKRRSRKPSNPKLNAQTRTRTRNTWTLNTSDWTLNAKRDHSTSCRTAAIYLSILRHNPLYAGFGHEI